MKIDGQAVFRCGARPYNGPGVVHTHLEKSLVQGTTKTLSLSCPFVVNCFYLPLVSFFSRQ